MKFPQFPLDTREFRLAMMAFFGVCAVVGILPFALWRFYQGEWITVSQIHGGDMASTCVAKPGVHAEVQGPRKTLCKL